MPFVMRCPVCDTPFDIGHDITPEADARPPQPGDIAICGACRCFLVVTPTALVLYPPELIATLPPKRKAELFALRESVLGKPS